MDKADFPRCVQMADAARDAKHWRTAAENYRAALDIDPAAAPLWVQYGHMLKEAGGLDQARAAYETALTLEPGNADTYLQLGHLLKLSNKKLSAVEMYATALELDPKLGDARKELKSLGAEERIAEIASRAAAGVSDGARTYLDVSDLLYYFSADSVPSGIQRIVMRLAEAALRREDSQIQICALDQDECAWRLLDPEPFLELLSLSQRMETAGEARWRSAMEDIERQVASAPPLTFAPGSVLIAPGAPWALKNYFAGVRKAKRESQICYVAFVHDLVPLMFPEYCETVRPKDYVRWIASMAACADLFVANSANTKRDLERSLAKLGAPPAPCEVLQPNGAFPRDAKSPAGDAQLAKAPANYVLMVGTIEPRKNHLLVFTAWRQLIDELGPERVPNLLIAGRYGWCCDDTRQFLSKTDFLGGKVTVLEGVSDSALPSLYRGARFTIYNSHYEGWGLPVTESLSFGKIPVVARNSGLVESGGENAVYFETNSVPSLAAALRPLIEDPDALRGLEATLESSRAVRSWDEVLDSLRALTGGLVPKPQAPAEEASGSIRLGELYVAGHENGRPLSGRGQAFDSAELESACTMEALLKRGDWYAPEEWGMWSRKKDFELTIPLPPGRDGAAGDSVPLILYLHVLGHRETSESRWEIDRNAFPALALEPNEEKLLRVRFRRPADGAQAISVKCAQNRLCELQKHHPADKRLVGIAVRALMICREDDLLSRLTMIEHASGCRRMDALDWRPVVNGNAGSGGLPQPPAG